MNKKKKKKKKNAHNKNQAVRIETVEYRNTSVARKLRTSRNLPSSTDSWDLARWSGPVRKSRGTANIPRDRSSTSVRAFETKHGGNELLALFFLLLSLSFSCTHAGIRAYTRTHTHSRSLSLFLSYVLSRFLSPSPQLLSVPFYIFFTEKHRGTRPRKRTKRTS